MIVVPEITMKNLMTQIVEATHGLTDTAGTPQTMSTIDEPRLRMAAIVAIQVATGEVVWPGDRTIRLKQPRQSFGIIEVER
jgi:hypothetical protein